jgi:integrase/recombinase XerD
MVRGARRINAVLTVVREFVKHGVATGVVPAEVLPQLYEVADDRNLPAEVCGASSMASHATATKLIPSPR